MEGVTGVGCHSQEAESETHTMTHKHQNQDRAAGQLKQQQHWS